MITELNRIEQDVIWWIVDTDTEPIIGMDNLDRLGLHLKQRSPKSDQREAIRAIEHSETEKPQFSHHGTRKQQNDEYGDPKDQNPKKRKAEKLRTTNYGARKREKADPRAPQQQTCHKTVPDDSKCPKAARVDQEMSENGDPELETRRTRLKGQFHKLFNVNTTVKNFEYNV